MLEWYSDNEIAIFFDKIPDLDVQFVLPCMTKKEIEEINKKPFVCEEELKVILYDGIEYESYEFTIPKGYSWMELQFQECFGD